MHNYFDISDFHEMYRQILGFKEIKWLNYIKLIPQIKEFLEREFKKYQESYIEVDKWNENAEYFRTNYKVHFLEKNKTDYNLDQPWPLLFSQYILYNHKNEPENELFQFVVYLDNSLLCLFNDNHTINDNYMAKIEFTNNFEEFVKELFYAKGNRWINKCETIYKEFVDMKFDYYIFNPIIRKEFYERDLDKNPDQLLIVKGKHFIVYTIKPNNYYRVDFDVPKNVEHVYSNETEEVYISSIKVFRIDEKINVFIPKTDQRNIVLKSIY